MAEYNITTPTGFFNSTIAPVFSEDIFSAENLSQEGQRPDLTPITTIRQQVDTAANDGEISSLQFDAAASLARQKLLSNITSQDTYTRGKRDLEFNINAERDIQFNQGQQLLRDLDTYITASRATVVQREYEEKLKEEEKKLEEKKKEELQLMAMKLGIDPNGLSRKDLRTKISAEVAKQYKDKLSTDRMGKGGASTANKGLTWDPTTGSYKLLQNSTNAQFAAQEALSHLANISSFGNGDSIDQDRITAALQYVNKKYGWATGEGAPIYYELYRQLGKLPPKTNQSQASSSSQQAIIDAALKYAEEQQGQQVE